MSIAIRQAKTVVKNALLFFNSPIVVIRIIGTIVWYIQTNSGTSGIKLSRGVKKL